jgi:hypothetical protein
MMDTSIRHGPSISLKSWIGRRIASMDGVSRNYSRHVRPRLPNWDHGDVMMMNGIIVSRNAKKLLDTVVGDPSYENFACTSLRKRVSPGDTVSVIGGGFGVTSVVAARIGSSHRS